MKEKLRITGESIIMGFISILLISLFTSGTLTYLQEIKFGVFISIAIGQGIGLGLLGTIYLNAIYKEPFKKIKFNFERKHLVYIAGIVLVVILFNVGSQAISSYIDIQTAENTIQQYLNSTENIIVFFIISLIVVGPLEEYFYRGIMQERFKDAFEPLHAIILTSLLFSVTHLGSMVGSDPEGYIIYLISLFAGAMIFGYSYEKTDNLAIPMLAHGLYNGVLAISLLRGTGLLF